LSKRLKEHYEGSRSNILLQQAFKKYGIHNFTFYIIEYVDPFELISREQFWMDYFNPEYNILKEAGSSIGFKHSEDTKVLMSSLKKGFTHTLETKKQMSLSKIGIKNSFYGKTHSEEVRKRISEYAKNRQKDPFLEECIQKQPPNERIN
jgi:group I intron endonuclease